MLVSSAEQGVCALVTEILFSCCTTHWISIFSSTSINTLGFISSPESLSLSTVGSFEWLNATVKKWLSRHFFLLWKRCILMVLEWLCENKVWIGQRLGSVIWKVFSNLFNSVNELTERAESAQMWLMGRLRGVFCTSNMRRIEKTKFVPPARAALFLPGDYWATSASSGALSLVQGFSVLCSGSVRLGTVQCCVLSFILNTFF